MTGRLGPISIIPILLSGGSGTRLWPFSRRDRPKQFLSLDNNLSFFQSTILRCQSPIFDDRVIVVAAHDHRFLVAEQLAEIDCEADILLEPVPRNSCAAILAGCMQAMHRDPDAVVVILAADHKVNDYAGFAETITRAMPAAENSRLVTFGIKPGFPSTGYGYLGVVNDKSHNDRGFFPVTQFVEKPNQARAKEYVKKGYFWNSGNFMFKAATLLEEAEILTPEVYKSVSAAFNKRVRDLDFIRLEEFAFSRSPAISVDYAIMEKTEKAVMVPVLHDWSDIGTWQSVWESLPKNKDENALFGDAIVVGGKGNLVHSPGKLTTLVGVDDLAVVATADAVLVSRKDVSEEIKTLVKKLEKDERTEAIAARKAYRPWGNYDVLDTGEGYKVKRIEIKPDGILSLQRHKHRAEHWVLVSGQLEVTLAETIKVLEPNQSVYIDRAVVHRLANRGNEVAVLIEVQTGDYLGEDDVERLEDQYNRIDQT